MQNYINKITEKVGVDKILHFCIGFIITSLGFPFGIIGLFTAWCIALLMGISKEVLDQITYKGFDGIDLGITAAGASVALLWFLLCTL